MGSAGEIGGEIWVNDNCTWELVVRNVFLFYAPCGFYFFSCTLLPA
jgi:hypothetical protein